MDGSLSLKSCLDRAEGAIFVINSRRVLVSDIKSLAKHLVGLVSGQSVRRLYVGTDRVDVLAASLVVREQLGCDLVLSHDPTDDPGTHKALDVDAVIAADGALRVLPAARPRSAVGEILLMTSGTTGAPKAVRHAFSTLCSRISAGTDAEHCAKWLLSYRPSSFAGIQVLLTALFTGSTILSSTQGSVSALAALALEHRPTHISGTPTFWRAFISILGKQAPELPIRRLTLGGEAADQGTLNLLKATYPAARLSHIYASTEAGAVFSVRDGLAGFPAEWVDSGVEGAQLRIRDGALEIKSSRRMIGYAVDTPRHMSGEGEWIRTGDLVEREGDRVFFRGRIDDLINVGGSKVRPEEIEHRLRELDFISDVRVFGKPNPITGNLVSAEIVLDPNVSETIARRDILEYSKKFLESYKIPRMIEFVPAIITSSSHKKARR